MLTIPLSPRSYQQADAHRWPLPRASLPHTFPSAASVDLSWLPRQPCGPGRLAGLLQQLAGLRGLRGLVLDQVGIWSCQSGLNC